MQWDPMLECGVETVDNEHRSLFRMVGDLMKGADADNGKEISRKALDFLGAYVVDHFAHEEQLMEQCAYPKAEEHRQLHSKFVQTFLELKQKFELSEDCPKVMTEIKFAAMSWLVNHIKVIDRIFMQYYVQAMRGNPSAEV